MKGYYWYNCIKKSETIYKNYYNGYGENSSIVLK